MVMSRTSDERKCCREGSLEGHPAEALPNTACMGNRKIQDSGHTILLVEDDTVAREWTRDLLRRSGYQVLTADSEKEASTIWQKHAGRIDLLLTDVMIPNQTTGVELARRFRATKPQLKVVYISGFGREIGHGDTSFLSEAPYLLKPVSPTALRKTISQSLDSGANATREAATS